MIDVENMKNLKYRFDWNLTSVTKNPSLFKLQDYLCMYRRRQLE